MIESELRRHDSDLLTESYRKIDRLTSALEAIVKLSPGIDTMPLDRVFPTLRQAVRIAKEAIE